MKHGDKVMYVPTHAGGDTKHEDVEHGVVSSVNDSGAFVKFNNNMCIMVTGDEPYTAQHCRYEDLVLKG